MMTLPAETKFPCLSGEQDGICVRFDDRSVGFEIEFKAYVPAVHKRLDIRMERAVLLDREQVESLRDQLTQWLEVNS